jgi:hypothetical protein
MKDVEIINKGSYEINKNTDVPEQDNLILWIVGGMMLIWIYVIITRLF